MVTVAAVALGSSTYAWFVSNTRVSATSSSVNATSATALYPASTNDCKEWWAVSGWESNGTATLANAYYNPDIKPAANGDNVKDGAYTRGTTKLNAYQISTYFVYTTTGNVDLNLDPVNPITVDITSDAATGFKDALRVGIVVDGSLKLVYAPTAETGTGNDSDAQTGYRTVANSLAAQSQK